MTLNNQSQDQKLLMFLHLPKCAGTTLLRSIGRLGPDRHLVISASNQSKEKAFSDLQKMIGEKGVDRNQLLAITGHDVFIGMHQISDRECLYATVLRDPVVRYISHYRFFVDCAHDESHAIYKYSNKLVMENGKPISLAQFANRKIFQNVMATYLGAANHPDRTTGRASLRNQDEILELARGCLQRMDFIGLVEEFPMDLQRLCSLVDVQPAPPANQSVHAVDPVEIDAELTRKIQENNKLDIEIYRIAAELRLEKMERLKLDTSEAVYSARIARNGAIEASDLRRLNALEDEIVRLKKMYAEISREHERLRGILEQMP